MKKLLLIIPILILLASCGAPPTPTPDTELELVNGYVRYRVDRENLQEKGGQYHLEESWWSTDGGETWNPFSWPTVCLVKDFEIKERK